MGKLKKDIPFALRRGTIAQVTTDALDEELALNEAGWDSLDSLLLPPLMYVRRRCDPRSFVRQHLGLGRVHYGPRLMLW